MPPTLCLQHFLFQDAKIQRDVTREEASYAQKCLLSCNFVRVRGSDACLVLGSVCPGLEGNAQLFSWREGGALWHTG